MTVNGAEAAERPLVDPELSKLLDHPPVREIPHTRQVFVNRNLRMDQIEIVGFDMDYTLAIYRLRRIEELSFQMTLRRLIDTAGYDPDVEKLVYDWEFVIRGLVVDREHGNIFKMDRFNHVGRCYHGRKPLDEAEWKRLYRDKKLKIASARFASIDTLFALPEAALFAQIIELFEGRGEKVDYAQLYDDIRRCIDEVHRDGSLKAEIRKDLGDFFLRDAEIGPALHKLRSGGKKLFLLTNSLFDYTDVVLGHLLSGLLPEYPSWRNYFDYIVVGAQKPTFFSDKLPFFEVDEAGQPSVEAKTLERGRVYQGGNLGEFERLVGLGGERVLYVGDHIYGDILRSKKSSLWRTAMIVQELEDELAYTDRHADEIRRLSELESLRARLDDELNQRKLALNALEKRLDKGSFDAPTRAAIEAERRGQKAELEQVRHALKDVNREVEGIEGALEGGMNRYWGLLFKEGNENSRFGEQIEGYADLYTSRVSNFLAYSPMQYFRSPRAAMPHERGSFRLAPFGEDRL
ncbi:MAG TPA: HAD-IG family 5'-nucleotidase [Myxococcales bacterium]|nr:HAD-IG family 5'-nucleotidase [Myxococcales bacterium]